LREDWSGPDEEATVIAVLEALMRKASMGSVDEVGRAVCARSASEPRTSLETTDSGADGLTRRLSSVRRGELKVEIAARYVPHLGLGQFIQQLDSSLNRFRT
jgi:hypothetical protein